MSRLVVASALCLILGAAMLLSRLRWFSRRDLADRLRPYAPGGLAVRDRRPAWSADSFREVAAPIAGSIGGALSKLLGVGEELERRLVRIHADLDASELRTRQLGWSLAVLAACLVSMPLSGAGPTLTVVAAAVAPIATFAIIEHRVAAASAARQDRVRRELPVVAEQLGMLVTAGYSLGAALHRLARRGDGAVAEDLRRVTGRIRQGLDETTALREWADIADVDSVHRLVDVLALNREATDLGTLIADEARSARLDLHRELLASIERRDQQVWIPVAIAALVPGSILIAVPFIQAMRTFSNA